MNTCTICEQPVIDGQPRYGPTGNHYDCETPRLVNIAASYRGGEAIAKADAALAKLRQAINKINEIGSVERNKRNGAVRRTR